MKKHRISKKDWHGYAIILGVIVVMIAVVIVANFLMERPYPCADKDILAHTMIIIDTTDPLTDGQQKRVRELVKGIEDEIETREKFSIFLLETKLNGLSKPLFSTCKPPKGSEANPLYRNRRMYEKAYQESYKKIFENILPRLTLGGEGVRSPIMEALVEVGQRSDFSEKIAKRRLVIVSDLLQNTERCSFYKNQPTMSDPGLLPNLQGVKVELHIIQREKDKHLQGNSLMKFWDDYFRNAGAVITKVTKRF